MAVSSATPPVVSGSDSSSMEVTPAASEADCSAQENLSSSLVASSAMGDGCAKQSPSLDSEELLEGSSFHKSSGEGDMALDSPQKSTVPSAPAPSSSVGEATSGPSGVSTSRKRKTEVGPTPPHGPKKKEGQTRHFCGCILRAGREG